MFNSRTATHEFYPGCDLKFSDEPRKRGTWCNACGNEINGFVYYCKDKDLDLHPCCLELKGKMVTDGATFRLHDKSWKTGEFKDESTLTLSLKNPGLRLGRSSGGGEKYLKIVKALMTAVVAILLGDPTVVVTTTLLNLIT
ncbi:hypothetical protein ACET3Z_020076 [Daucus carota]|uniref:DC1 domain-containing protein n=1 Tax=Daucus carota subsp. sativus TaxID=79200 RepID=A0A164ZHI6_DAUCS